MRVEINKEKVFRWKKGMRRGKQRLRQERYWREKEKEPVKNGVWKPTRGSGKKVNTMLTWVLRTTASPACLLVVGNTQVG